MSVAQQVDRYLRAMHARGQSELTITNRRSHLTGFARFLEGQQVEDVSLLTREVIETYIEELSWTAGRGGKPLAMTTRNVRIASVKSFCRWLFDGDRLPLDPAAEVAYCREPDALPKSIPTAEQMQRLLLAPDVHTQVGFRDRLVLELLYSTALRLRELCGLDVTDLRLDDGFVLVRRGKGNKDRVVPVGTLAVELLESYLADIRLRLLEARGEGVNEPALILSRYGERLGPRGVAKIIARSAKAAGIEGHVTPHTFRHACATHMLRGGASIRHLQELLGHKKLTSTEVYTRVTIDELKAVHARFHPRGSVAERDVRPARRKRR